MKIRIPKDIVGTKFPKICTIDMNDFDIDLFLPSLFFTILSQGKGIARRMNDPKDIHRFVDALAHHTVLEGFDTDEGEKVLNRLVRTTLIKTGGVGRGAKGEQIMTIVPYSILAHKPGFPVKGSRPRGADNFIYQALRTRVGTDDVLREFVKKVFGSGVNIGTMPELGGTYDGQTQLDTLTRLSIAFLDGFNNTRAGLSREKNVASPCPVLVEELATDIYRYLFQYYDSMPVQAFTQYLLTLINFELFSYTLKLVRAVNDLVQNPDVLPSAMRDSKETCPPQVYIDFTESSGGYSQEMSKACVRRDIETYQQFLTSNLLLQHLDRYVTKSTWATRYKSIIEEALNFTTSGSKYLQGLLLLRSHPDIGPRIDIAAEFDETRVRNENSNEGEEEDLDALNWLDTIVASADGNVERVVALLVQGQRDNAIQHYIRWFWGVGGLKKPDGILRGNVYSRSSWRYAPTNNLLAVLVQLAVARLTATQSKDGEKSDAQPIRLQDFLLFLEERFGILVDRPPDQFEGAEYVAAARENLNAMLNRLRQMGIFRDLSDDFTVQRLYPPYASKASAKSEVL